MHDTKIKFARIDLILLFAKEFGHGLVFAEAMADNGDKDYVEWIEELLIAKFQS
jgi:hypothetical protein